jgi:Na+-transporting NADH:ubiquinone oxidoreductase subunit B
LTLGSFAFGVVYLATDPVTAAATNAGRWVYGLLIGALVVVIRVANVAHPDGVMFAILFGNIVSPLIDYLVVRANIRRRARRYVR